MTATFSMVGPPSQPNFQFNVLPDTLRRIIISLIFPLNETQTQQARRNREVHHHRPNHIDCTALNRQGRIRATEEGNLVAVDVEGTSMEIGQQTCTTLGPRTQQHNNKKLFVYR